MSSSGGPEGNPDPKDFIGVDNNPGGLANLGTVLYPIFSAHPERIAWNAIRTATRRSTATAINLLRRTFRISRGR